MLSNDASRATTPAFMPVVPGLHALRDVFVNLYYAAAVPEQPLGPWVLLDAGLPGSAAKIKAHAEEVFGPSNPPIALVLTHAHFDHAGSLDELLKLWDEFEAGTTDEAKFVRDLDVFEMALQASRYLSSNQLDERSAAAFRESVIARLKTDQLRSALDLA